MTWNLEKLCGYEKFTFDSLKTIQNSLNYWSRKEGLLIWSIIEMINFFVQMKLNEFPYLYSNLLGNHILKIIKKYLEIY